MASKLVNLGQGTHLSLSGLAMEFGAARETIVKRLAEHGVRPSGKRGAHPVYRLKDAIPALVDLAVPSTPGALAFDPDELKPFERKAHYQAEHEKLRLQVERGELVPRMEVEVHFAATMKLIAQHLDALPDRIERDCGAPALVIARIERELDQVREAIYADVVAADANGEVVAAADA